MIVSLSTVIDMNGQSELRTIRQNKRATRQRQQGADYTQEKIWCQIDNTGYGVFYFLGSIQIGTEEQEKHSSPSYSRGHDNTRRHARFRRALTLVPLSPLFSAVLY
jgi:hypothetical protein